MSCGSPATTRVPFAQGDMNPLHELFEQWLAADQDWRKSRAYIRATNKQGKVDSDARDWLTKEQLEMKIGKSAAASMVEHLEANQPEKVRDHPDGPPGVKDPAMSN